ncbi:MAG TPA: flagellar basal body-associated FliL family protein [candidate division Zixibacteria bacterium]|nr:flagellar basal body-associated FliL family protein [candidate division Zixibacteria bacterium]
MAADDEKTTVQTGDAEAAPPPAKGGNKMILFGGIGVGAIVIGVLLALFVIKPMMSGSSEETPADEEETEVVESSHDSHESEGHGGHGEEGKSKGSSIIYAMKDIVVNPAGTGGSRFLSASVSFELGSPSLEAKFQDREPIVRDALITILSSKSVTQLTDPKQKEIVRYQIKKRVAALMETDKINGVYFTDFVLQ